MDADQRPGRIMGITESREIALVETAINVRLKRPTLLADDLHASLGGCLVAAVQRLLGIVAFERRLDRLHFEAGDRY